MKDRFIPGVPNNHQVQAPESLANAFLAVDIESILRALNSEQLKGKIIYTFRDLYSLTSRLVAVEHDPSVPLQILAGPGSGKTKVCSDVFAPILKTNSCAS